MKAILLALVPMLSWFVAGRGLTCPERAEAGRRNLALSRVLPISARALARVSEPEFVRVAGFQPRRKWLQINLSFGAFAPEASCHAGSSAPEAPPPGPLTQASQGQPVRLVPQFTPGQMLRYSMEFRTTTEGSSAGLIEDPQAPLRREISVTAVVRLEVLDVQPEQRAGHFASVRTRGRIRLRATYEESAATSRSDSFDPESAAIEEQYRKLEGRSIEFTLDPDGKVREVEGLKEVFPDERVAGAARDWLSQLALGAALPPQGIAPGQKWSSEHTPNFATPLARMVWRMESTYLRNEPCRPAGAVEAGPADEADETCGVVLTRFEIAQRSPRSAGRDATPEEYRKRGLRTAGKWNGSGESLSYISLRTGWMVSVTQTGSEEIDITIATAAGESRVRYMTRLRTQSHITLIDETPSTSR